MTTYAEFKFVAQSFLNYESDSIYNEIQLSHYESKTHCIEASVFDHE